MKNGNEIMHYIHESETDNILRVANDLINSQNIEDNKNDHLQKLSSKYVKMSCKTLITDTSIRKCMGILESNLRKTIISTQERAIQEQLLKTSLILRVSIWQYTIKNCLQSI